MKITKKEIKGLRAISVYKPLGITPLDVIKKLKEAEPSLKGIKIGYAGRLDPMAEGLVLLLVGEENKDKKKYEELSKVYEVEVLLGFETDTYDILGKIAGKKTNYLLPPNSVLNKKIKGFEGKFSQPYPPYSSKTVDGKPLYYWSRKNLISKIKIPSKEVEIFSIKNIKVRKIKGVDLLASIEKGVAMASGDFRQEEILGIWNEKLGKVKRDEFSIVSFTVKCSSGTYMRTLAYNIGISLGVPTLALSIKRISVGKYVKGINLDNF